VIKRRLSRRYPNYFLALPWRERIEVRVVFFALTLALSRLRERVIRNSQH
jgi:hypothetical protein